MQTHQWIDDIFEYYWDDIEQTILIIEFHKSYDWADYHRLLEGVYNFIDGRVDEVAYINRFHKGVLVPRDNPLPHFSEMLNKFHNPFIVTIKEEHNKFIIKFITIFAKIMQLETRFAADIESARQKIAEKQSKQVKISA